MKKAPLLLLAFIAAALFSSCQKELSEEDNPEPLTNPADPTVGILSPIKKCPA